MLKLFSKFLGVAPLGVPDCREYCPPFRGAEGYDTKRCPGEYEMFEFFYDKYDGCDALCYKGRFLGCTSG